MIDKKHKDVIIAWLNGTEIEYKGSSNEWCIANAPTFDRNLEYRIKPKLEYIPFEVSDFDNLAHNLLGKIISKKDEKSVRIIKIVSTGAHNDNLFIDGISSQDIFKHYEFLDGTPIGKLKE